MYYLGRMIEEILYFDMMDLGELADHELDWEKDGFRPNMNQHNEHVHTDPLDGTNTRRRILSDDI